MEVGVVVIGRNEGERLRRCLSSLQDEAELTVYVDSGSTDGSVALARAMGAEVVDLDLSRPFSAARARNAGFARLLELAPTVEQVFFTDGDCEIAPGWLAAGAAELAARLEVAIVCGRLRERHPEASLYNQLADLEWDGPTGEICACGGIFMVRRAVFAQMAGFNPDLIAGEEPELCLRLRQAGWKVRRLDCLMARHDVAMTRFGQWWRRNVRGGYAFALGQALHGRGPARYRVRQSLSIWFWAAALPLLVLTGLLLAGWPALLLGLGYPALVWSIAWRNPKHRAEPSERWLYAAFCVLGKFAQLQGQVRYLRQQRRAGPAQIIEYKQPTAPRAGSTAG